MLAHVAENVALAGALGDGTATIVGHDWGSTIAAASALLRPDVFTAVALMGVPYSPPGGPRPTEAFAAAGGDEEFYVSYFQQPGRAEAEIEHDIRSWLAGFYTALTGGAHPAQVFTIPPGGRMRERFPAAAGPPAWVDETTFETAVAGFKRNGMTGPLNRYRTIDRDWEDLAAWHDQPLCQRSLYIAGAEDASITWLSEAIDAHAQTLPALTARVLLDGCGHWIQQERPDDVNDILTDWLRRGPEQRTT
jgi:pimeloyl-ACP methyl ester carboxylesterase